MSSDNADKEAGTDIIEPSIADESKPPDGGYGWVCVLACFLNTAFTWGTSSAFGVFLTYYASHEIFPGATKLDFSWVGGVNLASAFLVAPLVTIAVNRFGLRPLMYFGAVVNLAGFIVASFATTFWHLCIGQGILAGIGVGLVWIPSMNVLPQWFERRRSLAGGIASGGTGVGGILFSVITTPMIQNISVAWALRITGLVSFVIIIIATTLVRDRNSKVLPDKRVFDFKLLRNSNVLLVFSWAIFLMFGYPLVLYSIGPAAVSIGLTQNQASNVVAAVNVGMAAGRPFFGTACDRFGRMTVTAIYMFFSGIITLAMWIPCRSYGLLIFFGLLAGAFCTVFTGAVLPLSAEVAGLKKVPAMATLAYLTVSVPSLFTEVIAFSLEQPDSTYPFLYAQLFGGLTLIIAGLILVELRRRVHGLTGWEKHGLNG